MIRRVRMVIGGCLCAVAVILEGLELSNVTRETLPTWVLHSGHEITIPILIAGLVLIWLGKSEAKEENNANPQLQPVTNTNTNTASPTQNVEQHFHLAPPEIPKPPKATEPAKPRHNVQLIPPKRFSEKSKIADLLLVCLQNVPIPHVPVADLSYVRAKIDYFNEANEQVCEAFPGMWSEDEGVSIDMEPGKSHYLVLAAFSNGKWKACHVTQQNTSWGDVAYDFEQEELPLGRLLAVVTLIGEHNISLDPVRFLLQFNQDGSANLKHLTDEDKS